MDKRTVYKVGDKEFDTADEAEMFQRISDANKDFENAKLNYVKRLADFVRTADGFPLKFGEPFYYTDTGGVVASYKRLIFYPNTTQIEIDSDGDAFVIQDTSQKKIPLYYLYSDEHNAVKAVILQHQRLIEALRRRIKDLRKVA